MTSHVVSGIDCSEDSPRALRGAAWMARRLGQTLMIVHAVEPLLASAAQMQYGDDAVEATLTPELKQFVTQTIEDRPPGTDARMQFGAGEPAGIIRGTALSTNA